MARHRRPPGETYAYVPANTHRIDNIACLQVSCHAGRYPCRGSMGSAVPGSSSLLTIAGWSSFPQTPIKKTRSTALKHLRDVIVLTVETADGHEDLRNALGMRGHAWHVARETSTSRPRPRSCCRVTVTALPRPHWGRSYLDRLRPLTSETAVCIFRQ